MYKGKDRKSGYLFEELFPFGGSLDENNRWLKISSLLPWEELERKYRSYFSDKGRPALDGKLVIGLLLLKHMTGASDKEVTQRLRENPYWQAFCGFDNFVTDEVLNSSSLTKLRKRLGAGYMKELEVLTYKTLIDRKIIRGKGMLVDGTVFPENIKYPNDVGLLNDVREWLVENITKIGKKVGKRYRTYKRTARKKYLKFSKTRRKTRKFIRGSRKKMLQHVRRNIRQLTDAIEAATFPVDRVIKAKLETAREIYEQQMTMHSKNLRRVNNRIVSFNRDYVRPIKRGKAGKDVEFGPKAALTQVDGFLFLDKLSHDNFSEAAEDVVKEQIENYEEKFGKRPDTFTGDQLYGSRNNRKLLEQELEIRSSFVSLGRKSKTKEPDRRVKVLQKERNRIEGSLGTVKEHYGLSRIKYHSKEGAEQWIRLGILGMNLKTALARM